MKNCSFLHPTNGMVIAVLGLLRVIPCDYYEEYKMKVVNCKTRILSEPNFSIIHNVEVVEWCAYILNPVSRILLLAIPYSISAILHFAFCTFYL